MKRWLFTLTDPTADFRLIQVIAPSKEAGVTVIAKELGVSLDLARTPQNRVLATNAGEDGDCHRPHVEFFVRADGTRQEAA